MKMKYSEAMAQADILRSNTCDDKQKALWIYELDCDIANIHGVDKPEFVWPDIDAELIEESPHDNIYPLYLAAKIDYYNQETSLYSNDMAIFNAAYNDARAEWRRNHRLECKNYWKVM